MVFFSIKMKEMMLNKFNPLGILNFATFMQYQRFVMPISFLFYLHNGLTFSDFIFCQSLYNASCLSAKLTFGFVGDIFPKKYILIFAYFLFMMRVLLWINFSGFWVILAGEILYGLFKAFYRGNVDSYIYEWLEHSQMSEEMISSYGKLSFYNSMGSAVSCFAGVILFKYFGFKTILYLELVTQILAISALCLLPKIKSKNSGAINPLFYIKSVFLSLKSVLTNVKVNYYVFYSAMLSGLTNVFVWNFQPLLKLANAPVFLYGVINFINQVLRGVGGIKAKSVIGMFTKAKLFYIVYSVALLPFGLLLVGHFCRNYIFVFSLLTVICLAILLFVVFGIFNISKIHEYSQDSTRASSASVNTFVEDFASFLLLLGFKFLYDWFGFVNAILIFAICVAFILFPKMRRIKDAG